MMHVHLVMMNLKPFARSLWWMFTGWSAIDGQSKGDPIKKMIDAI